MALVTLTTDFGTRDAFAGIMKGVIASRAPGVTVVDLTHGIPAQDVLAGALTLQHAVPYFPPGTVHVAVVDPGVGSARRPICIETSSAFLVGPDNGLLSLAAAAVRRIIHVTDERHFLAPRSHTFHGRDVFAPVAAALATGTDPGTLGPVVTDMVRLEVPPVRRESGRIRGEVIYVDGFGNLVTNVPESALSGFPHGSLSITIAGARLQGIRACYAAMAPGDRVAVVNSWGLVEIAVREGSARDALAAGVGTPVDIDTQP